MALTLAIKTMMGTAQLLMDKNQSFHPRQLKDAVASPGKIVFDLVNVNNYAYEGGTTIYGLQMMENAGIRAALMETVTAATNRAAQLES